MRSMLLVLALVSLAAPAIAQAPAAPAATTAATPPATTAATPALAAPAPATQASAAVSNPTATTKIPCADCKDTVDAYWWAFWVITGFIGIALVVVVGGLSSGQWSLTDALTDKEAQVTRTKQKLVFDARTRKLTADPTQPPEETTVPAASASRLIALVGTVVLTGIMLGVGYGMVWSLFTRGEVPKLDGIGPYLLGGSALFAPYAFNQLKDAFKPKVDATQ